MAEPTTQLDFGPEGQQPGAGPNLSVSPAEEGGVRMEQSTTQGFWIGTGVGIGAVILVALGVVIGVTISGSSTGSYLVDGALEEMDREKEILLVDPVTRAPAREALMRWGRIASPSSQDVSSNRAPPSAEVTVAQSKADRLAHGGDMGSAALILEKARLESDNDAERTALALQQVLMLNSGGQVDEAARLANEVGRTAHDFETQRAALGVLEGLE